MLRVALGLCFAVACCASVTLAQEPGQRQYYSEWKKHSAKNYYYCYYYYKKSSDDQSYAYHYGIYYPSRGKRVYMFNPQERKFWGYWDAEKYSLLPKEKQKAALDEIAAEDFPPPGAAPNIPGIADKISMIAPSSTLPSK
ncbi:MAG: hypothetical protein HYR84_10755 [Planctomycetes bacterium]|nr:hypothetical protein [Planctomycetota bacterium]